MFEIFLWAILIGGLPTAGYYLFVYGRKLHARGRKIKETGTDAEEASVQWRAEMAFTINCCIYGAFGLLITHLLQTISEAQ